MSERKVKCLLCREKSLRSQFKLGWRYKCDNHPWYGLDLSEHIHIEEFVKDREERLKLVDWLRKHPPNNEENIFFTELTMRVIKQLCEK